MNREIKYQFYDKINKKIYQVTRLDLDRDFVMFAIPKKGNEPWQQMGVPKSQGFIRQFTGLKSKSGIDIYEGDIIQYNNTYNLFESDNYQVSFRDCEFILLKKGLNDDEYIIGMAEAFSERNNPGYAPKDYEVIGNIYENPELLK